LSPPGRPGYNGVREARSVGAREREVIVMSLGRAGGNQTIVEHDSGRSVVKTVAMTHDVFGRMLTWSDGTDTETHTYRGAEYYNRDGLGSVRNLTDANENVQSQLAYTAFGGTYPFGSISGAFQRYTFTGRESSGHSVAGAPMFYRYRQYSPGLGRFGRRDPVLGGDPQFNAYGYPLNAPVRHVDPMGTKLYATTPDAAEAIRLKLMEVGLTVTVKKASNGSFEIGITSGGMMPDTFAEAIKRHDSHSKIGPWIGAAVDARFDVFVTDVDLPSDTPNIPLDPFNTMADLSQAEADIVRIESPTRHRPWFREYSTHPQKTPPPPKPPPPHV
jgi:RHS repeat-associated protein